MNEPTANFLDCRAPFSVPDGMPALSPRAEYVRVLQQLHLARIELDRERETRQEVEDRVWADFATRLHATIGLREDSQSDLDSSLMQTIRSLLTDHEIEIVSATGRFISELAPDQFEILATESPSLPDDEGRISRTFRPLILRQGRVVQTGRVILMTQRNRPLETTT